MSALICKTFYVSGHVQGVGFRFFIFSYAQKKGLTGTVQNLDDGRVKIIACGSENQLSEFINDLNNNAPRMASISHIESYDSPALSQNKFTIL